MKVLAWAPETGDSHGIEKEVQEEVLPEEDYEEDHNSAGIGCCWQMQRCSGNGHSFQAVEAVVQREVVDAVRTGLEESCKLHLAVAVDHTGPDRNRSGRQCLV